MKYEHFFEIAKHYRIGIFSEVVFSTQDMFSNYTSSALAAPAFHPIPISKTEFSPAYRAHNYMAFGLRNIFIIRRNLDFRLEGYAFSPYRAILQDDNFLAYYGPAFSTLNLAGSAGLVFHTPVGPLSISVNYFEKNENPVSVLLNLGYIIFNSRSLD